MRTLAWTVIPLVFLITANWGYDLYVSYRDSAVITERIAALQSPPAIAAPVPLPPPRANNDSNSPAQRDSSIEIEALSLKLKMVNEASWTAIFKIGVLWSFLLANLLVYKLLYARLARFFVGTNS